MANKHLIIRDEKIDPAQWAGLVHHSPFSSPFQTRAFYNVCNSVSGLKSYAFAVKKPDHSYSCICVVCLYKEIGVKSYFSRRAIIYGGPLLQEGCTKTDLRLLMDSITKAMKHKAIYIEVRNSHNFEHYASVYKRSAWNYLPYLNIRVDLNYEKLNDLVAGLKYNRRREIRQTLNAGLIYKEAESISEIEILYEILQELYLTKVGLPIPNLDYFLKFWESKTMKIFIVWDQDKIVGGSFCPFCKNGSIYTFYYCGKRNYKAKVFPTHLAVMATLDFGIRNKLKYLDFMGAGIANADYGIRQYKKSFGGELIEEGRFLKILNKPLYKAGAMAVRHMKKKTISG